MNLPLNTVSLDQLQVSSFLIRIGEFSLSSSFSNIDNLSGIMSKLANIALWGLDVAEMTVGRGKLVNRCFWRIPFCSRWFTHSRPANIQSVRPLFTHVRWRLPAFQLYSDLGLPRLVVEEITIGKVTFSATVPSGNEGGVFRFTSAIVLFSTTPCEQVAALCAIPWLNSMALCTWSMLQIPNHRKQSWIAFSLTKRYRSHFLSWSRNQMLRASPMRRS